MNIFAWILTAVATVGVVVNLFKMPLCFYLWTVTAAGWMVVDIHRKYWPRVVVDIIHFILAVAGIFLWTA